MAKFWDKFILYKKRAKAELWRMMYVVLKKGRLTMKLGVVMTRQNFGFPCYPSCSVVCVMASVDRGRHERGGG